MRAITSIVFITLLGVFVLAALALAAVQVFDANLPHVRQALAERIGERIDAEVSIQGLDLRLSGQGPALRLTGVRITRPGGATLQIPAVGLHFSLIELAQGARLPEGIVLHQPRLAVTIDTQRWAMDKTGGIDWSWMSRIRRVLDYVRIDDARLCITLDMGEASRRIRLTGFDASVRADNGVLEISATAHADPWLEKLRLQARIVGRLPGAKRAQLTLTANNLAPVALWQKLAAHGLPVKLAGAVTDLQLTAQWQSQALQQARLELDTTALRSAKLEMPLFPAFQARLTASAAANEPGVIHVSLKSVSGAGPALEHVNASARINTRKPALTLRARHIAASLLAPAVRLQLPGAGDLRISGMIKAAELTLAAGHKPKIAVVFERIWLQTPQFSAGTVSGNYYRSGDRNILRFTDAGGMLRSARYLQGKLPITDLEGQLSWKATGGGLKLVATNLELTIHGKSKLRLSGSLTVPADGVPVADLKLKVTTPDASQLLAHVPQTPGLPFDRLRDWLPKAIAAGNATLNAYLTGPLDQMFAGDGKHFGVTIRGTGFALEYKPGWPRLTHATGTIRLRGDTLDIDIKRGQMLGVEIGHAEIHVDNVRKAVLHLKGTVASASAAKMMSFLAESPLQERFGRLVEALAIDGKAGLDIKLRVPLMEGHGDVEVSGVIHAQNTSIGHNVLPAPIESVSGDIRFSGQGLRAENLTGELLGVTLTTDIEPAANGHTVIRSRGRITLPEDGELLAHYVPGQWLEFVHGSTMLEVTLRIDSRGNVSGLTLHSDLQGMALELPEPLHKPAATAVPLRLKVKNNGRVTLRYGDNVRVDMTFERDQLSRAVVLLGATPDVQSPAGPGLWLGGHVEMLAVGRWLDALNHLNTGRAESNRNDRSAGLSFRGANLDIDTLRFGARRVRQVHLRVEPLQGASGWQLSVRGPNARGSATWRPGDNGHGMLRAHFARLHIETGEATAQTDNNAPSQADSVLTDFDPRRLPSLDVTIEQLTIGSTELGTATVKAAAIENGWRLDKATLSGGRLNLTASGKWQRRAGFTSAQLELRASGHGLADLMQTLGYDPVLRAQRASLQASLEFAPSPRGLDLAALNGEVSLSISDGIIRTVNPGAARLLGLFNLYVLPRRLMLDFSDVVKQGLVFESISGDFEIITGDAFTDNLTIQTPSAKIRIVGRIDLAAQKYDMTVIVNPKFGSSLTLAGTLLGGPLVGAAVFALQGLLDTPLDSLSSFSYQVKGHWGDPKIVNPQVQE